MRFTTLLTLALGLSAWTTFAQDGSPGGRGRSGGERFPMDPVLTTLDANTNNVIEASEINNARDGLKKLDKNNDGKLSSDEIRTQQAGGGNQPSSNSSGGGRRPTSPLMSALDANENGELDATEIANASTALKKLDSNSDGQLSRDEIMPKRPGGIRGPGGPSQQKQ